MSLLNRLQRTAVKGLSSHRRQNSGLPISAPRASTLALAVASCFVANGAIANPYGFSIVNGQVFVNYNGNTLNVTNSPGAIINWQGFSIGVNEITRFIQQSASSTVLNRVVGADPSIILGTLQSNGRVFLINPNGVVFGAGSKVDVAGLVASSMNLTNADFAAGKLRFGETPGAGNVVNQGTITTPSGGQVYLVAPNVQNHGIINSPQGEVILAAGKSVELFDSQTPNLRVQIDAPNNEAVNLGQIVAQGGKIGVYAGLIKNSGEIRANGVVVGANGEILLKATKNVTLEKTSVITANGPQGGKVTIQSDTGTVAFSGTLEANGTQGKGGSISVSAPAGITVDAARISANGTTDGGSVSFVSVGNVAIAAPVSANAGSGRAGEVAVRGGTVYLNSGALLAASGGLGSGVVGVRGANGISADSSSSVQANGANGGTVSLQADQGSVSLQGTISVSADAGNGGNVDINARNDITLDATSSIAANGRTGGTATIQSTEGTLLASGLIDARGSGGPGGKALLMAPRVVLLRRALIDVTGQTGGGTILIGGDFQGLNPSVQNAWRTYVGRDVMLRADAGETGNGGKVIVWSDDITRFYGTVSARGGSKSGDGGFVEISGKHNLDFNGRVDVGAQNGKLGNILFDPDDIVIVAGSGVNDAEVTADGVVDFSDGTGTFTIGENALESLTGVITLRANNSIVVSSGLNGGELTLSTPGTSLVLEGVNNITVNSKIYVDGAISFYSNSMAINADITSVNDSIYLIPTIGSGTNINIVGTKLGGSLELSPVDLNHVHLLNPAAYLQIGDPLSTTGNINVATALSNGAGGATHNIENLKLQTGSSKTIDINAPVTVTNNLILQAGGDIRQNSSGVIKAAGLAAISDSNVLLNTANNLVDEIGGHAHGNFLFKNAQNLTVGSVAGSTGISVDGVEGSPANAIITVVGAGNSLKITSDIRVNNNGAYDVPATIDVSAPNGVTIDGAGRGGGLYAYGGWGESGDGQSATINVDGGSGTISLVNGASIYANAGSGRYSGQAGGEATVTLTTTGSVSITSGSMIEAYGGWAHLGGSANGGDASVAINSGAGGITMDGAEGGAYVEAGRAGDFGGYGGHGSVTLDAGGGLIWLNNYASIEVYGGYAQGGVGGNATITLQNATHIVLDNNSWLYAEANEGLYSGGTATINLSSSGSGGIKLDNGSSIEAYGGYGGDGGEGSGSPGGDATITLTAGGTGPIILRNSARIYAEGGWALGDGGDAEVTLNSSSGGILLETSAWVKARGGNGADSSSYNGDGGDARVNLQTTGNITVQSSARVEAIGGDGGSSLSDGYGGDADINLSAGAVGITVDGGEGSTLIQAVGGTGGYYSGGGGDATISIDSGSFFTVNNSTISAYGGGFGASSSGASSGGNATIDIAATGPISIMSGSSIYAESGGDTYYGSAAYIELDSQNTLTIDASSVQATATFGQSTLHLLSTGDLNIGNSQIISSGGAGTGGGSDAAGLTVASAGNVSVTGSNLIAQSFSVDDSAKVNIAAGADRGSGHAANKTLTFANTVIRADGGEGGGIYAIATGNVELGFCASPVCFDTTSQGFSTISIGSTGGAITNLGAVLGTDANGDIQLGALKGIGTVANPVRVTDSAQSLVACNGGDFLAACSSAQPGAAGDIAIAQTSGNIIIDNMSDVVNFAANGGYDVTAEAGNIQVTNAVNMTANGSGRIGLHAMAGSGHAITIDAGSGLTTTNGLIVLQADVLSVASGANSINAGSTGTIQVLSGDVATAIDLGGTGSAGVLGVNNTALAAMNAGTLRIGETTGLSAMTGSIAINGPILPASVNVLSLETLGNIAQSSGVTVSKLVVKSAGNVDLSNMANSVGTVAADLTLGAGTFAFANAGAYAVGSVNGINGITVANNVTLGSNGVVTQSQPISATGLELLGTGTFNLNTQSNTVTTLAGNTGTVKFKANGGFDIGTINGSTGLTTSGNTTLDSTGMVSQSAALNAAGLELLGTGGSYVLYSQNNAVTTLAANTGLVQFRDDAGFNIGTVNSTPGLTVSSFAALETGGTVTQNQKITASQLELLGVGGVYNLNTQNNVVTTLAGNTGSVAFKANGGFDIGFIYPTIGLTTTGTTTLDSTGIVTQSQAISANGLELLGAGGTYNLNTSTNSINTLAVNTGTLRFKEGSGFTIGTVNSTNGVTTTGIASLDSVGSVTQSQKIIASGLELLGAGGSYMLTNGANDVTTLAANTGSVTYNDVNALLSGTVGGTTGITGSSLVTLTSATLTGSGVIGAPTVNLTTANGMSVKVSGSGAGLTAVNTTAGDLILTGTGSTFIVGSGGATFLNAASGGVYNISALNNMQLNAGTANDRLSSFAAGGTMTVNGYSNVSGYGVTMAANGVTFSGTASAVSGSLSVISGNSVDVNTNVIAGTVNVVAGSLTVTGANFDSTAANFNGYTTGDVTVAGGGRIYGNPDLVLTVGGNININGAGSKIEAVARNSVRVTFPTQPSGGYSVNGNAGVVWDAGTGTGFFAGGSPAALGDGFVAVYSSANNVNTPTVITALNNIVDSTNKSSPGNEKEKKKDSDTNNNAGTNGGTNSRGLTMQCGG